ncbi:hypothetical protein MUK42_10699 [Musa troglodytarum]|uniref:Uncharacterized protein n=1 Tax=Musa troglodytarum TaxID=320322 RepID=A0A9E7JZN2_9LILI|nr:hypothetical protein MUK42_10699 [Musa troglodytarum]
MPSLFHCFACSVSLLSPCNCFNPKRLNFSSTIEGWSLARKSYLQVRRGLRCLLSGFHLLRRRAHQTCSIECTENAACSGNPVTIVLTNECPGKVDCNYVGTDVAFHAEVASNPYYSTVVIEYGGDGDLACVDMKEGGSCRRRPTLYGCG